ncbi:MAG: MoxR family ATPase [Desulfosudaceae bacterium]
MTQPGDGLTTPVPEEHFFLSRPVIENLERIKRLAGQHPVNVLVSGPQGCGKSTLVRQFAARHQRPLATFQIGILSEPGQLFGEYRLTDGKTEYQEFLFPRAVRTPGCVIHLEEINRPEHPKALNMLFSILSDDRSVWTDELGLVEVAEEVIFFATLNEGEEFAGTEMLDAALADRFYVTMLNYLPPAVEAEVLRKKGRITGAEAQTLVNIANKLRTNAQEPVTVSTRHALMMAEMMAAGASVKEAITYSLPLDRDTLESALLSLHLETGARETWREDDYQSY